MVVGALSTLRFVVLRHEGVPDPHFDFMLEVTVGEDLPSWRAAHWPPSTGDYFARFIGPGGVVEKTDLLQFSCAASTAVVLTTWGRLKARYR